jgi:hypothetical protein
MDFKFAVSNAWVIGEWEWLLYGKRHRCWGPLYNKGPTVYKDIVYAE